jgi:hypothetical protein
MLTSCMPTLLAKFSHNEEISRAYMKKTLDSISFSQQPYEEII